VTAPADSRSPAERVGDDDKILQTHGGSGDGRQRLLRDGKSLPLLPAWRFKTAT